jgi:hypothetical protein
MKAVFGFVCVDIIAFEDFNNKNGHKLFYFNGLDCYLNDFSSAFFAFNFVSSGKIDIFSGKYYLSDTIE